MALVDWEVVVGEGFSLTDEVKYHGEKSLECAHNSGPIHLVHSDTYMDSPKNVRVTTYACFVSVFDIDKRGSMIVGAIARKPKNESIYFAWFLYITVRKVFELEVGEMWLEIENVSFNYGVWGGPMNAKNVTDQFRAVFDYMFEERWYYFVFEGYQIGKKFNMVVKAGGPCIYFDEEEPETTTICSGVVDIPKGLEFGGGCGIIVGNSTIDAEEVITAYDYTQLWY